MSHFYPAEFYWSWEGSVDAISWARILDTRRKQLEAKAAWLTGRQPGRLLDIGSQKGEFLWFMKNHGWSVEGVEMDSTVPNPANMPIRYGNFIEMEFEPESFDVITIWAVLEHVYQPAEFIRKAARLLKPGGRIVVLVTNLNSIQSRWYRQDDFPRHLTLFTKKALTRLFETNGLQLAGHSTDQKIFGGALSGGLVYSVKRLAGYSSDEAFSEWKQIRDPNLFWIQWRGQPSQGIRWISRFDRIISRPVEAILDRLGFGFIITVSAEKLGAFND